jgi:cell division protein FtsI/penicillin-binding protein 2
VKPRLHLVFALGFAWVLVLGLRLYQLQVVQHSRYVAKAERQQQRVVKLDSPRGTIYDAAGRELAVSVQVDSAYAVPDEVQDPSATARALAAVVPDLAAGHLAAQLSADREFVWVARKLDPPVAAAVRRLRLPGIYFLPESKRYYPMRQLAAQVLGWVGTDNHGLAGLELVYDKEINGKPGIRTVLRDARRGTVVSPDLSFADPEPGRDLYLSFDAAVQHMVERELARVVEERHAKRGSALFLDPATGAVIAMASYPSFDPNQFSSFPPSAWRNRTIADAYEPGSTFKVVTAAAAIESGLVRPDDPFDCGMGRISLGYGYVVRDHKPYGILPFADVIAKSSNVGVIRAALLIGADRLYRTIAAFGFGRPTGIDLPGENAGILHPLARWGPLTKAYIAFGQGISVTPIQLAAAVAVVANEGNLLRPYIVAALKRGERIELRHREPPVVGHPVSAATLREVKRMLERVVTSGTGKSAAIAGYRVAGKTGTAQIPVAGGYARHAYLPSFVGFAPAERPAVVGVVAVAEPQGEAYYGAQVAAPIFGALTRQILLYMRVRPERARLAAWPGESASAVVVTAANTAAPAIPGTPGSPAIPANPASPATIASAAAAAMDDDALGEDVAQVSREALPPVGAPASGAGLQRGAPASGTPPAAGPPTRRPASTVPGALPQRAAPPAPAASPQPRPVASPARGVSPEPHAAF